MKKPLAVGLALVVFWLAAPPLQAGWASLGDVEPPQRDGASLLYRGDGWILALTPIGSHVMRVRFSPTAAFGRDHSWAIDRRPGAPGDARYDVKAGRSSIETAGLRVEATHRPLRLTISDAAGRPLVTDDAELGLAWSGQRSKVWHALAPSDHVYGFGEKTGRLDKRGWQLGGYSYAMWNSDTYAYDSSTDPIYAAVPFFMVMRGGRAHGVFLDESHRSFFDVGREYGDKLGMGTAGGELDYYVIAGPEPKQVIERYTELTGRHALPPLWSLGLHQCRYSYYPEARVRLLAQNFRVKRIPADALWLDIHYLEGYNPFTWDRERFPDPAGLISDLAEQGFKVVTTVDAHPAQRPGWDVYDSGLAGDHFVKNPDGSVYAANVWPSLAEEDPFPSVFPDFSRAATREWWGGLFEDLLDQGVAGIWNDMNEPAVFDGPTYTLPIDRRHDGDGEPTDHAAIHNVYGLLMTEGTYKGLLKLRPERRPFVLTRATFAGGQRWAAVWPGDNSSTWTDLNQSVPLLLGMGVSGLGIVGADVGGFAGAPSGELFTRWLQAALFSPFMRIHTTLDTPEQEPWSYGSHHEQINRELIEERYRLLPHIYSEIEAMTRSGVPAMRPLFVEFPDDQATWGIGDSYLFGGDLLAAPVLEEGATSRGAYLPSGTDWYDYWTGARFSGGRSHSVPVHLDTLPLFVRAGAFVFRQPVVQNTGEMPGQPLEVVVYPAESSERELYEDAGDGFGYRDGEMLRRRFRQTRDEGGVTVAVVSIEGRYRPAPRRLELRIRADADVNGVRIDGVAIDAAETGTAPTGWAREADGFVSVWLADRFERFEVRLDR